MFKSWRHPLSLSALVLLCFGGWSIAQPATAQVLVPYTLQLDFEALEEEGLILAQEAAQLTQFQQYEAALPRAQLAAQLAPQDGQVWALLGSLYLQMDQTEEGIEALKQARTLDRENASILFALGSASFRIEDYQASVDYLKAGLVMEPETPSALFDLGNAYYLLTDYDAAIAAYDDAIDQDESFWPAVNNIGLVFYENDRVDAAVQQWESALEIAAEPQAEPQLAIAVAEYTHGNRRAGLLAGVAALALDPRYGEIEFLKENLWGEQLLADTTAFFADPLVEAALGN